MNVKFDNYDQRYLFMSMMLHLRLQRRFMGKGMKREGAFNEALKWTRVAQMVRPTYWVQGVRVPHIVRTCPYLY